MTAVNVLGIAGSLIVLVALFEMLRRHRLREKYAIVWFVIAVGVLVVALFPVVLLDARHRRSASRCRPTCSSSSPRWCC